MKKLLTLALLLMGSASACWNGTDTEGKNKWYFASVEYVFNQCEKPEVVLDSVDWLAGLNSALKTRNIKLITTIAPIKTRVYAENLPAAVQPSLMVLNRYDRLMALLKQQGVAAIDVNQAFKTQKAKTGNLPLFYKTDFHWSSKGSDLAAQLTADWITKSRAVATSPEIEWKKTILPIRPAPFTVFGTNLPIPPGKREQYVPIAYEPQSDNLLGDNVPDIAVVGDSFAHGEYENDGRAPFSTAIGYYTKRDVLNAAQAGRGPFRPFLDYVISSAFQKHPPKVLVFELWEALMQSYDGGDGSIFKYSGKFEDNFYLASAGAITGCLNGQPLSANLTPHFDQFISFSLPAGNLKPQITLMGSRSRAIYELVAPGDEGNIYNVPLADVADGSLKAATVTLDGKVVAPNMTLCTLPASLSRLASLDGKTVDLAKRNFPDQVKFFGMYPVPDESVARWGLNEQSSVQYYVAQSGTVKIGLAGTSYYPGQTITVTNNGQPIGVLKTTGKDNTFIFSGQMRATAGKNVLTLQYAQNVRTAPAQAADLRVWS